MRRTALILGLCVSLTSARDATSQSSQTAYLKASNTGTFDHFSSAVAISGDTLVVGAETEASNATGVNGDGSNNLAPGSGAAYVFLRSGTGWLPQAYLKASNTEAGDNFGRFVAISGNTIAVGAAAEDSDASGIGGNQLSNAMPGSGAVYVFVRNGASWSQQAYIKASNPFNGDGFGFSVALSGDTLVVGAIGESSNATGINGDQSDNSIPAAGAAYVFVRSGTTWTQQADVKASNTGPDGFGWDVDVAGDTLVVGARTEASMATGVNGDQLDNSFSLAGAAYVFVRSGTTWTQQAYLKASNTGSGDEFGARLVLSGDTLVIAAVGEDSQATGVNGVQHGEAATDSGAAYVFTRSGATWSQQAYLKASNTGSFDWFGRAVGISGDAVVVGAMHEDSSASGVGGDQGNEALMDAGAAYVFVRDGATWSQHAYLKASNPGFIDEFGGSLAMWGDTLVIGAEGEDSSAIGVDGDQSLNNAGSAGAAYAFDLDLDAWSDLGSGLAGSGPAPWLDGGGPLSGGTGNQLALSGGLPSSAATLVVGLSQLDAPFKGGTLVPHPLLLVPLATTASGTLSLPFTWPAGVPALTALYFQVWMADPGAPSGFAASNGLEGLSS